MKPVRFWTIWLLVMAVSSVVYMRFGPSRKMDFIFGTVEKSEGTLQVLPPNLSVWLPSKTGEPLEAGSLVATGQRSEAVVALITGERIRISEQTQISIQNSLEHNAGPFINILQGTIRVDKPISKEKSRRSKLESLFATVSKQVDNVISNPPHASVVASGQIIHLSSPESDMEVNVSKDNNASIKIFSGSANIDGEERTHTASLSPLPKETTQPLAQREAPQPVNFALEHPPEGSTLWTLAQTTALKPVRLQWKTDGSTPNESLPKEFRARVHSSQNLHTEIVHAKLQSRYVQSEISQNLITLLCPSLQKSCVVRTMLLCKTELLEEECSQSTEFSLSQILINENKSYSIVFQDTVGDSISEDHWMTQRSNAAQKHNTVLSGKVLLANKHRFHTFAEKPEETPFHETAKKTFATGAHPAIQILEENKDAPPWMETFATENELLVFEGGNNAYQNISWAKEHCAKTPRTAVFVKSEKTLALSCWQIHNAPMALNWLNQQGWTFLNTASPAKIYKTQNTSVPLPEVKHFPKLPTIAFFQSAKPASTSSASVTTLRDNLTWLPEARQQTVEASISLNKATFRDVWGKAAMWPHIERLPFDLFALTDQTTGVQLFVKNGQEPRMIKSSQDIFQTLGFHAIAYPIANTTTLAGQGYAPSLAKNAFGVLYARNKANFRMPEAIPIALVKSLGVFNKTAFFEILISAQENELPESFVWMEAE